MKKKVFIIVILTIALITVCFRSLIGAVIIHSEHIGKYELISMLKSRIRPEKTTEVSIDGIKYQIVLPNNAVRFSNAQYPEGKISKQYLVPAGSFNKYINKQLQKSGWAKTDQLGAMYIINNKVSGKNFGVIVDNFTRFYYRISYFKDGISNK